MVANRVRSREAVDIPEDMSCGGQHLAVLGHSDDAC